KSTTTTIRNFPILDISEWIYDKTPRTILGPITFRTWDFSGQNEFQSIYQYFFTRRTLYLICWKMTEYDMNEQIFDTIHNILINIQVSFCFFVFFIPEEQTTKRSLFVLSYATTP
ncbi:unnamed protein product, partial [Rotaria sp. Silwood1]